MKPGGSAPPVNTKRGATPSARPISSARSRMPSRSEPPTFTASHPDCGAGSHGVAARRSTRATSAAWIGLTRQARVTLDRDRFVAGDAPDQVRDQLVALADAVDGEDADEPAAEQLPILLDQQLGRALGRRVIGGAQNRRAFAERRVTGPIHRRRRGEHESLDARAARVIEQPERSRQGLTSKMSTALSGKSRYSRAWARWTIASTCPGSCRAKPGSRRSTASH